MLANALRCIIAMEVRGMSIMMGTPLRYRLIDGSCLLTRVYSSVSFHTVDRYVFASCPRTLGLSEGLLPRRQAVGMTTCAHLTHCAGSHKNPFLSSAVRQTTYDGGTGQGPLCLSPGLHAATAMPHASLSLWTFFVELKNKKREDGLWADMGRDRRASLTLASPRDSTYTQYRIGGNNIRHRDCLRVITFKPVGHAWPNSIKHAEVLAMSPYIS